MVKIDDPQWATKTSDQLTQAFVSYSTETKSKMAAVAAMLDQRRRWSSKGIFLQLPPMSHQKIRPVDPGVGQKINGNQIQDGGHSGQLGSVAELIIERNLPLVTPNEPPKNRTTQH
jgi:hypothetical protein